MMMKKHITRTLIASAVLFSFNSTAATSYFEAGTADKIRCKR